MNELLYQKEDQLRYYSYKNSHYLFDGDGMNLYRISKPNNPLSEGDQVPKHLVNAPTTRTKTIARGNSYNAIIEMTDSCNLRCVYCYRQEVLKSNILNADTAVKIIDHIVDIDNKQKIDCRYIRVIFFGGEPLLNFKVLKLITEKLQEKIKNYELTFSISTNGVLLNGEILKFLCDNKFSIQLSFEGDDKVQGTSRPFIDGSNSYSRIIENINNISNDDKKLFTIAMTLSKLTGDISIVMKSLINQGFRSFNLLFVTDDVLGINNLRTTDYHYIHDMIKKTTEIAVESIITGDYVGIHPITDNIQFLDTRTTYGDCDSSINVEAFGTDGKIYQCQRFLSIEESCYGKVGCNCDQEKLKEIRRANKQGKDDCFFCWLKGLCPGKCAFLQKMYDIEDDISQTSCIIQHALWTEVIKGYIRLKEENPESIHRYLLLKSQ